MPALFLALLVFKKSIDEKRAALIKAIKKKVKKKGKTKPSGISINIFYQIWWAIVDSNHGPLTYQISALTT